MDYQLYEIPSGVDLNSEEGIALKKYAKEVEMFSAIHAKYSIQKQLDAIMKCVLDIIVSQDIVIDSTAQLTEMKSFIDNIYGEFAEKEGEADFSPFL